MRRIRCSGLRRFGALRQLGGIGQPLHTLFGGPHTSEPSFRRATMRSGDDLYPIAVRAGTIYVLSRVRVRRILSLEEYFAKRRDLFAPYMREPPAWVLERGDPHLTPRYVQALESFDRLRETQPEFRYLASSCADDAVECEVGPPHGGAQRSE